MATGGEDGGDLGLEAYHTSARGAVLLLVTLVALLALRRPGQGAQLALLLRSGDRAGS